MKLRWLILPSVLVPVLAVNIVEAQLRPGTTGGVTGWPTVATNKVVTWANSFVNALGIGDGTDYWAFYRDPTDGLQFICVVAGVANDCNYIRKLASGKSWGIADSSGNAVFSIVPSGATPKEKYPFGTGHYPLRSLFIGARNFDGDGTNCPARPTVVTINSGPKIATYVCTENDASRLHTAFPMPTNWDGGTIYIQPYYIQTAADTGSVLLDVAAACRGMGETFNGTYGTEVNVDDAAVTGSNAIDSTLSSAVTPNGTCAAGDYLYFYIDVDATSNPTTAAATLNLLGARIIYSVTSLSE